MTLARFKPKPKCLSVQNITHGLGTIMIVPLALISKKMSKAEKIDKYM